MIKTKIIFIIWLCLLVAYVGVQAWQGSGHHDAAKKWVREYPFMIHSKPEISNVRVLNIQSKYQQGMLLAAGDYHVEVSSPGHVTRKRWVKHETGKYIEVLLKREVRTGVR